ncbi:kelch repeat-containing protein [Candidatus Haliotispira prima]|uniref:Kelch repeat-containing protein n=1 Tax=Candidatus Haliotispira prima TaxID=3034016 RepID=A0ABY8MIJ8_9SPIO|nr:kelch repeat-containing protein [Candidatus Haliotispira prima]
MNPNTPNMTGRIFGTCVLALFIFIAGCNDLKSFDNNDDKDADKSWGQLVLNAPFTARKDHTMVVSQNTLFLVGGVDDTNFHKNDVWKSSDGVTWSQVTAAAEFTARSQHASVVLNNEIFVIGGVVGGGGPNGWKNDVWKSSDGGVSWSEVTANAGFSPRRGHAAVVLNNEIFVIGGSDNLGSIKRDVWKSSDGKNWQEVTPDAGFSVRLFHTATVWNNGIVVIGGHYGSGSIHKTEVWRSPDGKDWIQVTEDAGIPARSSHATVVLGNEVIVIGGNGTQGKTLNDAWRSSNGRDWTQIITGTLFEGRQGHVALAYKGGIFIIGGALEEVASSALKNDVWAYMSESLWNWYLGTK